MPGPALTPRPLLILGTRSLALEVADLAVEVPEFRVAGFVENLDPERCRETLDGLPIHWVDDLSSLDNHVAVCGLATTHRSRFTDQVARHAIPFATLIHPFARVSSRASLGEGTIVSAGVIIAAHARIGRHVLLNRGVLVGHHTEIGDHVSLQPGANVAGACTIGEATYVGMGAVIIDHLAIGSHCVIAAGAVVVRDLPDRVQVAGVPARVVKENVSGK